MGQVGNERRSSLLMQSKNLLIVFAKNIILGKVKTRLAVSIGDNEAFNVYKYLIEYTEKETQQVENCDVQVYFSDVVVNSLWPNNEKYVQQGNDLGERMLDAFKNGFNRGYERIIGVGTDLPDLNHDIMQAGIEALKTNETVFGPAEDGGYYLIGMNQLHRCAFENKKWSTDELLKETLQELDDLDISYSLLQTLNDIDTLEDLQKSSISEKFSYLLC